MPVTVPSGTNEFNSIQVCKLTGLTYRQLDYMCRLQVLVPSIAPAVGSGSQRLFSPLDLMKARFCKVLLDLHVRHNDMREVLDMVGHKLLPPLEDRWFVAPINHWRAATVLSGDKLLEHMTDHPGRQWTIIPLAGLEMV